MGVVFTVCFVLWFFINIVALIPMYIECNYRIKKLIKKSETDGLNLLDFIFIGLLFFTHLIMYVIYIIQEKNKSRISEFFHKPRYKKGK